MPRRWRHGKNFFTPLAQSISHSAPWSICAHPVNGYESRRVADDILAAVERRLLSDLRSHAVVREVWSPVDLAVRVGLERGGIYGARLDLQHRVLNRVSRRTASRKGGVPAGVRRLGALRMGPSPAPRAQDLRQDSIRRARGPRLSRRRESCARAPAPSLWLADAGSRDAQVLGRS